MKSTPAFSFAFMLVLAWPAPGFAQKKNYYYQPVTKDSHTRSSSVPWRDENGDGVNDAEQRSVPQRTRYHYSPVYRDRHLYSPYRYQPSVRYPQPEGHRTGSWWGVGSRLPAVYYAPKYAIDYRRYRLPPPATGQRWVRVENDVYLVNSASGQIRDAIYQLFY